MKKDSLKKLIYIAIPVLVLLVMFFMFSNRSTSNCTYSDVVYQFQKQNVESFTVNDGTGEIEMKLIDKVDNKSTMTYKLASTQLFIDKVDQYITDYNNNHKDKPMEYDIQRAADNSLLYNILPTIIIMVILIFVWVLVFRKMGGMGGKEMQFGKAKFKNENDEKRKTTFDDVAGADEEKEELEEVVEFLKNPAKFQALGARIPKGVLLVGPPGTGKTLLAKAVSGEAGVPFFSISGSDFVEMFVGVGASRVRDLFEQAKKNAPCLVFIDEIDAVGRRRGAGLGGGHDEREQTLNQLLVEMDGFGVNQGVIVMAATNRPDILDPALLRPGRFDRQVVVGAPDAKGREEILQVHARGKKLAPDVDLKDIANTTQGFTGADLENLLNEAALHAARKNKKEISMQDIKDSFIRVALGTEKKSHIKTELERKITAYHEAGHAILFEKMPDLSPVHTVSIIPIGMAGGYTMPVPTEKSFRFKRSMEQEIVATFGGRVAEEMIFGDYTQGASKDIEQATNLARNMVTRFGMSEKMGPILYGEEDHEVFLGRDIGHSRNYGENVAGQIDSEIRRIIDEAYNKAKEVLEENRDGLERTAQLLLKKEKVSGDEFREVLNNETVEEPQETVVIDSEHFNAENSEN